MIDATKAMDAIDDAGVGVFAFRDAHGRPIAVPVTPYTDREHGRIVVTSTLAYIRKAELVRRDGRVALLAGGVHVTGDAAVTSDATGDVFAARYLAQELRKYPPARGLVEIPNHRSALSWYFGRAIVSFKPRTVEPQPGDDFCTLVSLAGDGYPRISLLEPAPDPAENAFALTNPARGGGSDCSVLFHRESPDYSELRWLRLEGDAPEGAFATRRRVGSLDASTGGSPDYAALEARARGIMAAWTAAT